MAQISLVSQTVKHLPTMWKTWVQTLGQEDFLKKEMVTCRCGFSGAGWHPRSYVSNRLPGDASVAGPWNTLEYQQLKQDSCFLPGDPEVQQKSAQSSHAPPGLTDPQCSARPGFHLQGDRHDPRLLLEPRLAHCASSNLFLIKEELTEEEFAASVSNTTTFAHFH